MWKPAKLFKNKRAYKIMIVVIGFVLVAEIFLFSFQGLGSGHFASVQQLIHKDADELRIAAELSNMTGVTTDDILVLKNSGKSWNEVIELLKSQDEAQYQKNQSERHERLAETGLSEEDIDQWRQEGYTEEVIMEAKMLVERVLYQLNEIVEPGVTTSVDLAIDPGEHEHHDDLSAYQTIVENFQMKKAIHLMLTLKNEFGSLEEVLNEYLFSLQVGIDLGTYTEDKEQYLQEKRDKEITLMREDIMTINKIENRMLQKIQKENAQHHEETATEDQSESGLILPEDEDGPPLPDIPQPNVQDIKPKNPVEEMMKEIEIIDQKKNN